VLSGSADAGEATQPGLQRAQNAMAYLTKSKGIDPQRIQVKAGTDSGRKVESMDACLRARPLPGSAASATAQGAAQQDQPVQTPPADQPRRQLPVASHTGACGHAAVHATTAEVKTKKHLKRARKTGIRKSSRRFLRSIFSHLLTKGRISRAALFFALPHNRSSSIRSIRSSQWPRRCKQKPTQGWSVPPAHRKFPVPSEYHLFLPFTVSPTNACAYLYNRLGRNNVRTTGAVQGRGSAAQSQAADGLYVGTAGETTGAAGGTRPRNPQS